MADNSTLTIDDLNRYLVEKSNGPLTCPVCKTTNFQLLDEDPAIYTNLYHARASMPPSLTGKSSPAVSIFCSNCGNFLFFNRGVIIAWKLAKP